MLCGGNVSRKAFVFAVAWTQGVTFLKPNFAMTFFLVWDILKLSICLGWGGLEVRFQMGAFFHLHLF